jgi:hypothetical protein
MLGGKGRLSNSGPPSPLSRLGSISPADIVRTQRLGLGRAGRQRGAPCVGDPVVAISSPVVRFCSASVPLGSGLAAGRTAKRLRTQIGRCVGEAARSVVEFAGGEAKLTDRKTGRRLLIRRWTVEKKTALSQGWTVLCCVTKISASIAKISASIGRSPICHL